MENKDKKFYLTIQGQKVEVSEDVYRAYVQPIRREQRQKRRDYKCQVRGKKGKLVRCQKDCRECPYAMSGHNALGNKLSLDWMKDDGIEIEDRRLDVEQNYIDNEEKKTLYAALKQLTPKQQELVRLIYVEEKTQEEVGELYGVSHQAISKELKKILEIIKSFF